MGNSEVGHLTIGSGRILYQDLVRVNRAIEDGSFFENEALLDVFRRTRARARRGAPPRARLQRGRPLARRPPASAARARRARGDARPDVGARVHRREGRRARVVGADLPTLPAERIATVTGRYYAMDRDERWERTQRALDAILDCASARRPTTRSRRSGRATRVASPTSFSKPIVLRGRPRLDPDRDAAIVFNFRPDRVRQLTRKLLDAGVDVVTMTRYSDHFECPVVFPEQIVTDTLAEVVSKAGLRQLHAAETEKYAHVTYFLNGGVEEPWPGEARILVPSPRDVPSYDLAPEMSAVKGRGAGRRGARRRRTRSAS